MSYSLDTSFVCIVNQVLKVSYSLDVLRGDTVVETKATLNVARARLKRTLIIVLEDRECNPRYHRQKMQTLFQKGQYFAATYQ